MMNATSLTNASSVVSEIFSAAMNNVSSSSSSSNTSSVYVPTAPTWMVEFMAFRQRLFLQTVEPIIIQILGPIEDDNETGTSWASTASATMKHETSLIFGENDNDNNNYYEHELLYNNKTMHRRLGFLPEYIENASVSRDTSMSFATLITLFGTMSCLLLIFLSCFYHNQKTSPLFISPRRHRLPKLVPPPLPVEGYFDWVS